MNCYESLEVIHGLPHVAALKANLDKTREAFLRSPRPAGRAMPEHAEPYESAINAYRSAFEEADRLLTRVSEAISEAYKNPDSQAAATAAQV